MRTITKVIVFMAILTAFYVAGGLNAPDVHSLFGRERGRVITTWLVSVALFGGGAATAVFGDRKVGDLAPVSMRALYVLAGTVAMIAAGLWCYAIKSTF